MKLLILYTPSTANHFIVSSLLRKFDKVLTIQEDQNYIRALRRTFKRKKHSLISKINRLLFYVYFLFILKRRLDRLFSERLSFSDELKPDHRVKNINDTQAIQAAKEFSPDLVLVFGTSLLKSKWFTLNVPIVNSHLGIIPRYRGWLCWFWAILEENFDSVGVSIHYVTKVADGGDLIIQDHVDIFKLEKIDLPHVLLSVTLLVDRNITRAIEKIARSEKIVLDFDTYRYEKKCPHYFEPGITDYLKFVSLTKKLNKQIKKD